MTLLITRLHAVNSAITAFERVLTPDLPVDLGPFLKCRIVLSRAVAAFIADELSDDAALSKGDPGLSDMHHALIDLRGDYAAHVAVWHGNTVTADWPAYRASCERLIRAMRALLHERADLDAAARCRYIAASRDRAPLAMG